MKLAIPRPFAQCPRNSPKVSCRWQHSDSNNIPGQKKRDLVLSVLEAQPSARDSRSYLKAFAPNGSVRSNGSVRGSAAGFQADSFTPTTAYPGDQAGAGASVSSSTANASAKSSSSSKHASVSTQDLLASMPTPDHSHTALVKVQGPFTDRQLESIAEGLVYLGRLGLFSIIVIDSEEWSKSGLNVDEIEANISQVRRSIQREMFRLSAMLDSLGRRSCPLGDGLFTKSEDGKIDADNLQLVKAAIAREETPIIAPIAIDTKTRASPIQGNLAVEAIAHALCKPLNDPTYLSSVSDTSQSNGVTASSIDPSSLVPVRIMIINREGGIPSPARGGDPHLSINLAAEYDEIQSSFIWSSTHPTALANLSCLRNCLSIMPRSSSAIIVSHRSSRSLIGNLITNRPAHSPSLNHSSVAPKSSIQRTHTPTIVRHGLPIRVLRSFSDIDQSRLTSLLEASFNRKLDTKRYYDRLSDSLAFAIIAGDYQGAAIVTNESSNSYNPDSHNSSLTSVEPIAYLDKFAVLPSLQGDGTVDFLWGALRDESFGLGRLDALNYNGGQGGAGIGRDLVWRSRADNPVNKWYFERSNGFAKISMGKGGSPGLLFWCEAEILHDPDAQDLLTPELRTSSASQPSLPQKQVQWAGVIEQVPSYWTK